jgi:Raf kinase inhibitor-like YbhB/YbcL family protein
LRNWPQWLLLGIAAIGWAAASLPGADPLPGKREESAMQLTSPAFIEGQPIPAKYTCDGTDVSPSLQWNEAPAGTKSFALICDDPDAPIGIWVHWVIYGLHVAMRELPEMVAPTEVLPNGAKQGLNDFRRVGYGGPCPPPGGPHRYFFKLYALDTELPLKPRATKRDLLLAMSGHILAEAQLMGTYGRVN